MIKNPNFIFDVKKPGIVDSCLSVIAQVSISIRKDTCVGPTMRRPVLAQPCAVHANSPCRLVSILLMPTVRAFSSSDCSEVEGDAYTILLIGHVLSFISYSCSWMPALYLNINSARWVLSVHFPLLLTCVYRPCPSSFLLISTCPLRQSMPFKLPRALPKIYIFAPSNFFIIFFSSLPLCSLFSFVVHDGCWQGCLTAAPCVLHVAVGLCVLHLNRAMRSLFQALRWWRETKIKPRWKANRARMGRGIGEEPQSSPGFFFSSFPPSAESLEQSKLWGDHY